MPRGACCPLLFHPDKHTILRIASQLLAHGQVFFVRQRRYLCISMCRVLVPASLVKCSCLQTNDWWLVHPVQLCEFLHVANSMSAPSCPWFLSGQRDKADFKHEHSKDMCVMRSPQVPRIMVVVITNGIPMSRKHFSIARILRLHPPQSSLKYSPLLLPPSSWFSQFHLDTTLQRRTL